LKAAYFPRSGFSTGSRRRNGDYESSGSVKLTRKGKAKKSIWTSRSHKKQIQHLIELHAHSQTLMQDEKSEAAQFKIMKNLLSQSISTRIFRIDSGTRTSVETQAASVMRFGLTTGPVLSLGVSSTVMPEFTALSTLFDEFKIEGVIVRYNPTNPYNRGAVTVSVPIALFFDDVDATLTPTNSNAGMGAAAQRGSEYVSFSPDHTFNHRFMRRNAIHFYDWTPVLSPGTEPSTAGGLYVVGDATLTPSIIYGYMEFWYVCQFRMRQ